MDYTAEERQILKQGREFSDLVGSPGWKAFEALIQAHIATRERIILLPITEVAPKHISGVGADGQPQVGEAPWDFYTRAASLEVIKGALIGLKLSLSLVTTTMQQAKEIADQHSKKEKQNV